MSPPGSKKKVKKKVLRKVKKKAPRTPARSRKGTGGQKGKDELVSRTTKNYDASAITVLEGLEPVRKRPAMYIGGVDTRGLHHLLWEILDNAIDEVINGYATTIEVELDADARGVRISDNGRGIPVDRHPRFKKSALEIILTTLHAGGKFDSDSYIHSGGLHGVGSSVVNALSSELVATVKRDGKEYMQKYRRGKATAPLKRRSGARGTGTSIYFRPDDQIFSRTHFDPKLVGEILESKTYLHRGLRIVYRDGTTGQSHTFTHQEGIQEFLRKLVADRGKKPSEDFIFYFNKDDDPRLEFALQWTDETGEFVQSYVNGVRTPIGGTHEQGFRAGVVKAVRNYIDTHKLQPKGVKIAGEDIREGLSVVLSIYLADPQFQGQTKDRLNNPEVSSQVQAVVAPALEQFFNDNGTIARGVIARIVLAARARAASRAASQEVVRKSAVSHRLNLPGKLADCESTRPENSEIFIVEGDSAGGSAKQARDRKHQAILPLRGKVLNTEQANLSKIVANKEIADIVSALGCGMGARLELGKLRYHRVVILTDADSDGHHIATLLLTFFYRHMPDLLKSGHVFLGLPPLYKIQLGKETHWAWDDVEKEEIIANKKGNARPEILRFKGLGEMTSEQLKETTLDPSTRTLQQVVITDELETDRTVSDLMGRDTSARYSFVMERASEADDVDI